MEQKRLDFAISGEKNAKRLERVVLHLDLDCFYCQVEQLRLGIPPETPLAVQQWDNVIAVNYPARAAGVNRHASYRECLKACPDLQLVHVPAFLVASPAAGAKIFSATDKETTFAPDITAYKASLQPYREASIKIFTCIECRLASFSVPFVLEKASVDEVYVDVSHLVDTKMSEFGYVVDKGCIVVAPAPENLSKIDWSSCGSSVLDPHEQDGANTGDYISDLRIFIGCKIAAEIRAKIFQELGYTVSAGIAHNKTLAKLASAKNKPNQQTFVRKAMALEWMHSVPFNRIRSLGGKLGKLVLKTFDRGQQHDGDDDDGNEDASEGEDEQKYQVPSDQQEKAGDLGVKKPVMASALWDLSIKDLQAKVGDFESAKWIYGAIRGKDQIPVAPRMHTKSFMSAKNLRNPIREWQVLYDWITLLATELSGRLKEDLSANNRWPHSITAHQKCLLRLTFIDLFQETRGKIKKSCLRFSPTP